MKGNIRRIGTWPLSHEEFWQKVFIASIRKSGSPSTAMGAADYAVMELQKRFASDEPEFK